MLTTKLGGDEMRLGYLKYVQGIQPNVPACTMCRHGLYLYGTCLYLEQTRPDVQGIQLFNLTYLHVLHAGMVYISMVGARTIEFYIC